MSLNALSIFLPSPEQRFLITWLKKYIPHHAVPSYITIFFHPSKHTPYSPGQTVRPLINQKLIYPFGHFSLYARGAISPLPLRRRRLVTPSLHSHRHHISRMLISQPFAVVSLRSPPSH